MPAICKLSFFRILMYQQTSATTCKAHDFYYSIKINARDKRRHKGYYCALCLVSLILNKYFLRYNDLTEKN